MRIACLRLIMRKTVFCASSLTSGLGCHCNLSSIGFVKGRLWSHPQFGRVGKSWFIPAGRAKLGDLMDSPIAVVEDFGRR